MFVDRQNIDRKKNYMLNNKFKLKEIDFKTLEKILFNFV